MSTMCKKYYIFLENNTLNFERILNEISEANDNLLSWSLQYDFINCNVKSLIDDLPKYLNYANIIDSNAAIPKYNANEVYNATLMKLDQLNTAIENDASVLALQNKARHIPEYYNDQLKEYTLQSNYISGIKEYIYNKSLFIYNYKDDSYPENFINLLDASYESDISDVQIQIIESHSFFHIFFLKNLINNMFEKKTNLKEVLLNTVSDFSIPAIPDITNIEDIIKVILMNQFSFVNVSDTLKSGIANDSNIITAISGITDLFADYLSDNDTSIKRNIVETSFDILNHNLSFDMMSKVAFSTVYFQENYINDLPYQLYQEVTLDVEYVPTIDFSGLTFDVFESTIFNHHTDFLNDKYMLRNYFYLLYIYRTNLQVFTNIIDLVMSGYIYNSINFDDIYYFNSFKNMHFIFEKWSDCLNYDTFESEFSNTLTATNYTDLIDDNNTKFILVSELYAVIEDFIKTDEYEQQVITIQNEVYSYLRSNGIIEKEVDWCNCTDPLELYLTFALKKSIEDIDVSLFKTYLENQISSATYRDIYNEDDFDTLVASFNDNYSYNNFEFYKSFTISLISKMFANSVHNNYKI